MSVITATDLNRHDADMYMSLRAMSGRIASIRRTLYFGAFLCLLMLTIGISTFDQLTALHIMELVTPVAVTLLLVVLDVIGYVKESVAMTDAAKMSIKIRADVISRMRQEIDLCEDRIRTIQKAAVQKQRDHRIPFEKYTTES